MVNLSFNQKEINLLYHILKTCEEEVPENPEYDEEDDYGDYRAIQIGKSDVRPLIKKLGESLSKLDRSFIDKAFLRAKYHPFNNEIDEKVYRIIEKAFVQSRTIEINYFNMENADFNKRYIIAYCHLRKEIRKFRTSRISFAKLTNKKYSIPKDFDKNEY
jgi:predicted DNA-binding transcriptional regulator YafY